MNAKPPVSSVVMVSPMACSPPSVTVTPISVSGWPSPPLIMASAATTLPTTAEERMYSPAKLSCTFSPSVAMVADCVTWANVASSGKPLMVTV